MANTYTQIFFHLVFSTKNRVPALNAVRRPDLFKYIWGIHKNLNCHLYRIGGVEDHVHILTSLHPTVCLSDYAREIKTGSSLHIKAENLFPLFEGWQDGYGAFTLSVRERNAVIEYIKNQEEHHRRESYVDEFRRLLEEAEIAFDERYLL